MAEKPTTRSTPDPSGHRHLLASVVVLVAGVGYVVFVKNTRIDRSGLSTLVIGRTGVSALSTKPVDSEFVSPAKSSFSEVKKAADSDPGATGGYGKEWSGSTASRDAATELVELLPTSAQAAWVRAEAEAEYSDTATLNAAHITVKGHFAVPGVAGAFAVSVATAKSSTASASTGTAIVFQQGRVVAVEYLQSSSGGLGQDDATAIARAEHTLLARSEPGFSLTQTSRPLGLSMVYIVVSLLTVGLILTVPGLLHRRRVRRRTRQTERVRYEYRARGGKAMRRHRPPAWAQRARPSGPLRRERGRNGRRRIETSGR